MCDDFDAFDDLLDLAHVEHDAHQLKLTEQRKGTQARKLQHERNRALDFGGRAAQTKKGPPAADGSDFGVEEFSGIKIDSTTRTMTRDGMRSLATAYKPFNLAQLVKSGLNVRKDEDWMSIGVLVDKSTAKQASNGSHSSVWTFSDLSEERPEVSVFLFGDACKDFSWKGQVGELYAICSPTVMPARSGGTRPNLNVKTANQLRLVGQSTNFKFCEGEYKGGKKCTRWVNKERTNMCDEHSQQALIRMQKNENELQRKAIAQQQERSQKSKARTTTANVSVVYGHRVPHPPTKSLETRESLHHRLADAKNLLEKYGVKVGTIPFHEIYANSLATPTRPMAHSFSAKYPNSSLPPSNATLAASAMAASLKKPRLANEKIDGLDPATSLKPSKEKVKSSAANIETKRKLTQNIASINVKRQREQAAAAQTQDARYRIKMSGQYNKPLEINLRAIARKEHENDSTCLPGHVAGRNRGASHGVSRGLVAQTRATGKMNLVVSELSDEPVHNSSESPFISGSEDFSTKSCKTIDGPSRSPSQFPSDDEFMTLGQMEQLARTLPEMYLELRESVASEDGSNSPASLSRACENNPSGLESISAQQAERSLIEIRQRMSAISKRLKVSPCRQEDEDEHLALRKKERELQRIVTKFMSEDKRHIAVERIMKTESRERRSSDLDSDRDKEANHPSSSGEKAARIGAVSMDKAMAGCRPFIAHTTSNAFFNAFGSVDLNSKEGIQLLNRQSINAEMMRDEERDQLDRRIDVLEKKDTYSSQVENLKMKKVKAFYCHTCKYVSETLTQRCRDQKHKIDERHNVEKRWFECGHCGQRESTLDKRFFSEHCSKCHQKSWKEAGAKRAKSAIAPADEFLARGVEHGKFLGVDPASQYVGRLKGRVVPI